MRISVRLDPERAGKLERLTARTRQTTSEVIERAIDLYHEHAPPTEHPYEVLMRIGFIGCGEGRPDSSADMSVLYEPLEPFENRLLDS